MNYNLYTINKHINKIIYSSGLLVTSVEYWGSSTFQCQNISLLPVQSDYGPCTSFELYTRMFSNDGNDYVVDEVMRYLC